GAAALGQHLLIGNLERAAALAGWSPTAAGEGTAPPALRPDVPETTAGVARYLREQVLDVVSDARIRRELRVASALLEAAAAQAAPDPGNDDATLEAAAARAERDGSADR